MNDKELRVTIKNRLGRKYGAQHVDIRENEERAAGQSVRPGADAHLPTGKKETLRSVEIETGRLMRQVALPALPPIPITIESPFDCSVAITQVSGQNKWKLEFGEVKPFQTVSAKDTGEGGDTGGDITKVNVTLGGDEPPAAPPIMAPVFFSGAAAFPLAWFISCCVANAGNAVWYAVPIVVSAAGIIGGLLARKKKKE